MGFKEDIDDEIVTNHLNNDEFAEVVNYQPLSGAPFDIQVIFDDAYEGIDTESGQVVNTRQPKITARSSDFTVEPVQGDVIERGNGDSYKVSQYLPGGGGISEILLHEV